MLFIFSTPVLIRHLWQLKAVVFLHWCLMCAAPLHKNVRNASLLQSRASKKKKSIPKKLIKLAR